MIERTNGLKHQAYRSAGAISAGGPQTLLFMVAAWDAEETEARRRAAEDAAIDAEGILAQAEEANALDPVG